MQTTCANTTLFNLIPEFTSGFNGLTRKGHHSHHPLTPATCFEKPTPLAVQKISKMIKPSLPGYAGGPIMFMQHRKALTQKELRAIHQKTQNEFHPYFNDSFKTGRQVQDNPPKTAITLANYLRGICVSMALITGGMFFYQVVDCETSLKKILISGGLMAVTSRLLIHFYEVKNNFLNNKKLSDLLLMTDEIEQINKTGRIARHIHVIATAFFVGTLAMQAIKTASSDQLLGGFCVIAAPLLAIWYDQFINQKYGMIHGSAGDHTVGVKKES